MVHKEGLDELDETSLRGVTDSGSLDESHLGFVINEVLLAQIPLGDPLRVLIWVRWARDLFDVDLLLFGEGSCDLLVTWGITELAGRGESNTLHEVDKSGVLDVVLGYLNVSHILVLLWLLELTSELSLVDFPVDIGLACSHVNEKVRDGHSVLGEGSGLVRADARG